MSGFGLGSQSRPCLRLGLLICLLAFLSVFYFLSDVSSAGYLEFVRRSAEFDADFYLNSGPATYYLDPSDNLTHAPREGYLVWSPSCRIPDIDPWHESIRGLIHRTDSLVCSAVPLLSRLVGGTLTLLRQHLRLYTSDKNVHCCYQEITRRDSNVLNNNVDDVYSMSDCFSLKDSVNLTSEQQFILVKCTIPKIWKNKEIYTNLHARVPIREDVKVKLQKNFTQNKQKMSVLIVGIDSISRLNIIRAMPKTVSFLRNNGWVEMKGYNKMDDNTFPNLMAILTGMNYTRVRETCMNTNKKPVDGCPFIWKNFSREGYITGYGEDEPTIGTFNFQKTGFFKTPTDYYLRPFMLAAEKNTKIKKKDGLKTCLGPTLSTDHIYKYATDFATTFRKNPYFALFWMNSLSHNNVNTPSALDIRTLKFLQDLTNNGVLNNTFVIFLSDHGMRFGKIRETYVGWLEERLPFIFMWMPDWYRQMYPQKYSNLLDNRDKLTTPFDLHLTLQEIAYNEHHNGTDSCPQCVSMFDEVPWNRSCSSAGVTEHWCTCSEYRTLSTEGHSVRAMVHFVMGEVNKLLEKGIHLADNGTTCAKLQVKRVLTVRSKVYQHKLGYDEYVVLFETLPGQALFEATVSHSGQFKLLGTVSRINAFGAQSKCMNDAFLKKYCFCKKT
ncbi:uncharacterized protein LOC128982844 [Macrosteles quadrilineatus]|uniref:uncharacterized protein LOC128982844 n=1 Tax=Macrosteles quadrilineatus TaxID=74068 RepID=UPI0023E33A65|nr:uncharacterized protein LOC128982844 [Macrosteles quadrilineatus]